MTMSAATQPDRPPVRLLRLLAELAVLLSSVVLMLSGFAKAFDDASFALTLAAHGLVPEPIVGQVASAVIIGEILIGAAAVAMLTVWARLALASGVLAGIAGVFGWYALAMTVFPPPEPTNCGCGLSDGPADWPMIAARNGVLALALASISLATRRTPTRHSPR